MVAGFVAAGRPGLSLVQPGLVLVVGAGGAGLLTLSPRPVRRHEVPAHRPNKVKPLLSNSNIRLYDASVESRLTSRVRTPACPPPGAKASLALSQVSRRYAGTDIRAHTSVLTLSVADK